MQQVAQENVWLGFENPHRWRLINLSGKPVLVLDSNKYFLVFSWNLMCSYLCPLPLVLSVGTTEISLAPSSFLPIKYLDTLVRFPLFLGKKNTMSSRICPHKKLPHDISLLPANYFISKVNFSPTIHRNYRNICFSRAALFSWHFPILFFFIQKRKWQWLLINGPKFIRN